MDLYGPPLPPGYVRPDDDDSDPEDVPSSSSKSATKFIGPQCPAFISRCDEMSECEVSMDQVSKCRNVLGPELPLQNEANCENSEEQYGPMPHMSQSYTKEFDVCEIRAAIEKRAENMKNKLDNKHRPVVEVAQREEWMTIPDTSRKNQLGAISRCLAPGKSSSSKEKYSHHQSEKDKRTTAELKKYNKSKRSESLLDMHQKSKKKKEKKSKHKKEERKAFDRDEISIKQFSKQQVNSVIDKAKYLNSRFSVGNKQYL